MKAETATEKDSPHVERPESRTESDVETIDGAQSTDTESGADTATLRASSSSPDSAASNDSKQDATKAQGSLTSKINNLVTTDLGSLVRHAYCTVTDVPLGNIVEENWCPSLFIFRCR
jgi:hypothetical protein